MSRFHHCGLFFTGDHIQLALRQRDREPFRAAWEAFDSFRPLDPLPAAVTNALRYRLTDDHDAGAAAVEALRAGLALDPHDALLDSLGSTVALAQAFECVRDHPAFEPAARQFWLSAFAGLVNRLSSSAHPSPGFVESLWLDLVHLVAGVVLEDERYLDAGALAFRQTITAEVRPEGYLPRAVEGDDPDSFLRDLLSVAALVLTAEAATHVGVDLWGFSSRGISVTTAAAYLNYYHFFPGQWRWGLLEPDRARALVREFGGFFEIVGRHGRLRDLQILLDDLRPLNNPLLAGPTTITHGSGPRRGIFG